MFPRPTIQARIARGQMRKIGLREGQLRGLEPRAPSRGPEPPWLHAVKDGLVNASAVVSPIAKYESATASNTPRPVFPGGECLNTSVRARSRGNLTSMRADRDCLNQASTCINVGEIPHVTSRAIASPKYERRCLGRKESFRDCSACPEMIVVPTGMF